MNTLYEKFLPKWERKHRRRMRAPGGKWWIVSSDYGQIEARVIAMASEDTKLTTALWEDYDIHLEWAEKIAKRYSKTYKKRGSDMKAFRSDVKNQWVFPQFFGAFPDSCARNLEMPVHIARDLAEEFWDDFSGVKTWQEATVKFYQEHGYVECLTGRRRHYGKGDFGPSLMSLNAIINTPIQGTAADIVVDAMDRLDEYAWAYEQKHMSPLRSHFTVPLNVHDDLTSHYPDDKLESSIEKLVETMCRVPFKFVNVPIQVEVSIGKDWYDMHEIGKFKSTDFE